MLRTLGTALFLDKKTFSTIIEHTPLVSIDLIVTQPNGQVLLGKRLNRPAKGSWFVPGGRILKNESIGTAFKRLTLNELGTEYNIKQAQCLGTYDHFYADNTFDETFSTHYVVLAYKIELSQTLNNLPMDEQHSTYQWFDVADLLKNQHVHLHTKWYFDEKLLDASKG